MAPSKKKTAASAAATGGSGASAAPSAIKQAAEVFAKFKKHSKDKRQEEHLQKLWKIAQSSPCAGTCLLLGKALVLRAVDTIQQKCLPASDYVGPEEASVVERMRAEDDLEVELVELLGSALQQVSQAVLQAPPKERGLRCLLMAVLLAGVLRARGTMKHLVQRRLCVEQLLKLVGSALAVLEMGGNVAWVPAMEESPLVHRWPFEKVDGRPAEEEVGKALVQARSILASVKQVDEEVAKALADGLPSPSATARGPALVPTDPREPLRRVQGRLSSWRLLPLDLRKDLAARYGIVLRGEDLVPMEAASYAGGSAGNQPVKLTRLEVAKLAKQEERQANLAKFKSKAEEAQRKKELQDAYQGEAAAALMLRLQQRAEAVQQVLGARVKAAGDSEEAQMAALLGSLRMSVADMERWLQMACREKEMSEAEVALSRAALKKLLSGQQYLFACTPEMGVMLSAEEAGGPGGRALPIRPSDWVADTPDECRKLLLALIAVSMNQLEPLLAEQSSGVPILRKLQSVRLAERHHMLDPAMPECLKVAALDGVVAPSTATAVVAPEDLRFLALAAEGQLAAAVYEARFEDYKLLQPCTLIVDSRAGVPTGLEEAGAADGSSCALAAGADPAAQSIAVADDTVSEQERKELQQNRPPSSQQPQQAPQEDRWDDGSQPALQLAMYMKETWASKTGLAGILCENDRQQPAENEPVDEYGYTYDAAVLVKSFVKGYQTVVLLEAAQKGERPTGWQWWQYRLLSLDGMSCAIGDSLAALLQNDKEAAVAIARATDAFNRWFLRASRAHKAWLLAQPDLQQHWQRQGDFQEEEQQQQQAAERRGVMQQLSVVAGTADDTRTVAAAIAQDSSGAPVLYSSPARGSEDSDEPQPFTHQLGAIDEVLCNWALLGPTAASVALMQVPHTVAADAADVANGQGECMAGEAAAWCLDQKRLLSERILLVLRTMHRGNCLTMLLLQAVLDFISSSLPLEAQREAAIVSQGQGDKAGEVPAVGVGVNASQGQRQAGQRQAGSQSGSTAEQEEPPPLSPTARLLLGSLPQLPLVSLHQLFAFVCIQLDFRRVGLEEVQQLEWAGQEELLPPYLQLHGNSTRPNSNGKKGSCGQQEVSVTEAALTWVLQLDQTNEGAAPLPDMAAPLQHLVNQLAALAAPAPCYDGFNNAETGLARAGEHNGSLGTGVEARSKASSAAGATDIPAASRVPSFLCLLPTVLSWQPPTTLAEQLRVITADEGWQASVPDSQGQSVTNIPKLAAQTRLATFYMTLFTAILTHVAEVTVRLDIFADALKALRDWADKLCAGVRLPLRERCRSALQLAHLLLPEAVDTVELACLCIDAAYQKQHANALAKFKKQHEEACAGLSIAVDEAQRTRLEECIRDLALNVQTYQEILAHPAQQDDDMQAVVGPLEAVQKLLGTIKEADDLYTNTRQRQSVVEHVDLLQTWVAERNEDLSQSQHELLHLCEQLYFHARINTGALLDQCCRVSIQRRVATDLLTRLLPAAWQAELQSLQAAKKQQELELEEEQQQRHRLVEAEHCEAQRKAKAKKGRKAAGVSRAASKADWREQLQQADEQVAVKNEEEKEEEEGQAEGEGMMTPEQRAGWARMERELDDDSSSGEWQQARPSLHPKSRRHQGEPLAAKPQASKVAVLSVLRPPDGQAAAADHQRRSAARSLVLDNDSATSSSTTASPSSPPAAKCAADGWSYGERLSVPAEQQGAATICQNQRSMPGEPQAAAGEDDDFEGLLAAMGVEAGFSTGSPMLGRDDSRLKLAVLQNDVGQYNCFLNVIVQCLWHCREVRCEVARWSPKFVAADPVVAALRGLFCAFQHQDEERVQLHKEEQQHQQPVLPRAHSDGNLPAPRSALSSPARPVSWAAAAGSRTTPPSPARPSGSSMLRPSCGDSGTHSAIDPGALRVALGELEGHRFGVGEMHDAGEVLLCLFDKVIEVERRLEQPARLNSLFGLAVHEEVHCTCGKTTHHSSYVQYFYNTQATTLRLLAGMADTMGGLLCLAEQQHQKSCDKDLGGCGAPNAVNHFLEGTPPRVFTLQLAWESHSEAAEDIAATLAAVDEEVDLGEVYQGTERGLHRYRLRSMVCYYGQHYQALVLVPEAGDWLMFDDIRVTRVGSWGDVRRKCEVGRIQPSMLFYEALQA